MQMLQSASPEARVEPPPFIVNIRSMEEIHKQLLNVKQPIFTYKEAVDMIDAYCMEEVLAFEKWVRKSEYQRTGEGFVKRIAVDKHQTYTVEQVYNEFKKP